MSLLHRALTSSHIALNLSVSVGFLFMSYFWYQNARNIQECRVDRVKREEWFRKNQGDEISNQEKSETL